MKIGHLNMILRYMEALVWGVVAVRSYQLEFHSLLHGSQFKNGHTGTLDPLRRPTVHSMQIQKCSQSIARVVANAMRSHSC